MGNRCLACQGVLKFWQQMPHPPTHHPISSSERATGAHHQHRGYSAHHSPCKCCQKKQEVEVSAQELEPSAEPAVLSVSDETALSQPKLEAEVPPRASALLRSHSLKHCPLSITERGNVDFDGHCPFIPGLRAHHIHTQMDLRPRVSSLPDEP